MEVDSSDARPLYAQVEAELASCIASGHMKPGDQLPTESALIQRFGVSRPTIRQAIQNLAARGLVEIRRGKGTFASLPKMTQPLESLSGFVEDMEMLGRNATARVIDKRIVKAGEAVARNLAVEPDADVVRIQRVRLADGVPVSFDDTFLPLDIGRKIMADDLETQPIFSLLEDKYGIPLIEAEYRLEALAAEPAVARALGVEPLTPMLVIERISYREGDHPIDYEKLYYRGDLVRFTTRLPRRAPGGAAGRKPPG
ncbi:MAG TPA: GntR family transcriptional regulator [Tepidisphaeraceae bacterium]|jgi:GntR family transcriptional regulator